MTTIVSTLVKDALGNHALLQQLIEDPGKVARDRQIPAIAAQAASIALKKTNAVELGVWY